eukprot:gene4358-biopygen344
MELSKSPALQKALWWYNGSIGIYMSRPPQFAANSSLGEYMQCSKYSDSMVNAVRQAIPLPVGPGQVAQKQTGRIAVPTLFVCGEQDPYLLCSLPYALKTKDYRNAHALLIMGSLHHPPHHVSFPSIPACQVIGDMATS